MSGERGQEPRRMYLLALSTDVKNDNNDRYSFSRFAKLKAFHADFYQKNCMSISVIVLIKKSLLKCLHSKRPFHKSANQKSSCHNLIKPIETYVFVIFTTVTLQ